MFAEIILNKTSKELNRVFDYIIPDKLIDIIKLGDRVIVPFGRGSKLIDGIVINIKKISEFANKEIIDITDSYLTKESIEFAKLMARRYFCNDFECIKLMLPPGTVSKEVDNWVKEKTESFVYLIKNKDEINQDILDKKIKLIKHQKVLEYLIKQQKEVLLVDLVKKLDVSRSIIKNIEKNGYIEVRNKVIKRSPYNNKEIKRDTEYVLNDEQQYAYFRVNDYIKNKKFQEFLLYGVTGSRKNRSLFTAYKKCFR